MSTGNQKNWSPEQLEEWAKPALGYLELIRIARTARSNTEAKNLALEFTTERGLEEKVAMACRWLRILRVKDSERFKKLVFQIEQNPKKEVKEMGGAGGSVERPIALDQIKFKLPFVEITTKEYVDGFGNESLSVERFVKFPKQDSFDDFLEKMLEAFRGAKHDRSTHPLREREKFILNALIKILEEKFGLRVKICVNCKYYVEKRCVAGGRITLMMEGQYPVQRGDDSCGDYCWAPRAPKEVEEKK